MGKEVTQYTLLVAILALLIYIAVVTTGSITTTTTTIQDENSVDEIQESNLATYELVSGNLDMLIQQI